MITKKTPTHTQTYQTEVVDGEFVLFECDFFPKHGRVIITEPAESTAWTHTHTRARARARAHTHAHARTHAHTHFNST